MRRIPRRDGGGRSERRAGHPFGGGSFFVPADLNASIDPAEVAAALAYLSAGKLNVATSGPAEPLTYNQTQ